MVNFMSWNYEEIKKRKKALDKKSPFYKNDLENIKEMLAELGKESFFHKSFSRHFYSSPLIATENNLSDYHFIAKFTNPILFKAFKITEDYEESEFQKRLSKQDFTPKDYIEMIYEFAQTLPDPFKKEVKKYAHDSFAKMSNYFLEDNYASLKRVKPMHMKIDKYEKI